MLILRCCSHVGLVGMEECREVRLVCMMKYKSSPRVAVPLHVYFLFHQVMKQDWAVDCDRCNTIRHVFPSLSIGIGSHHTPSSPYFKRATSS